MSQFKQYKNLAIATIVALIAGIGIGYKAKTPQIETVVKEVIKEHVVVKTKIVQSPDGTTVTESERVEDKDTAVDMSVKAPIKDNSRWHVSIDVSSGIDLKARYGLQVERKVMGPISVGVRATTRGELGVVLGIRF